MEQSFDDVKVGDLIIYHTGGWHSQEVLAKVTKVTPKQFVVGCDRFRKTDGSLIGGYSKCRYATEADITRINQAKYRSELINKLYKFFRYGDNLSNIPTEKLEAIANIINTELNK